MDISAQGRALLERFTFASPAICRAPGSTQEHDLGWFDNSVPIALSEDGQLLLMQVGGYTGGSSALAFYLRRTDGSPPVRLGGGLALDLSPDGKLVLARNKTTEGLTLVPTGPGRPVPVERGNLAFIEGGAFLDGRNRLIVLARESAKAPRLLYVQDAPSGQPRAVAPLEILWASPSPDGRFVMVVHDFNEDWYVLPIDSGEQRRVPNTKGLEPIRWTQDGASFFAGESGSIPFRVFKLDVATGQRTLFRELGPPDLTGVNNLGRVVMTPDGEAYAYGFDRSTTSDLFLVEGLK